MKLRTGMLLQTALFGGIALLHITAHLTATADGHITASILGGVAPLHQMLTKHPHLGFVEMLATVIGLRGVNAC